MHTVRIVTLIFHFVLTVQHTITLQSKKIIFGHFFCSKRLKCIVDRSLVIKQRTILYNLDRMIVIWILLKFICPSQRQYYRRKRRHCAVTLNPVVFFNCRKFFALNSFFEICVQFKRSMSLENFGVYNDYRNSWIYSIQNFGIHFVIHLLHFGNEFILSKELVYIFQIVLFISNFYECFFFYVVEAKIALSFELTRIFLKTFFIQIWPKRNTFLRFVWKIFFVFYSL